MNIDEKQWHARITHFPSVQLDGYISYSTECNDFCSYLRWFLVKLFLVIPLFCIVVGALLGLLVTGVVTSFTLGYLYTLQVNLVFLVVHIIAGLMISLILWAAFHIYVAKPWSRKRRQAASDAPSKPDGFLLTAYKKTKYKFCPTLDYDKE